jgi:lipopolysaccharide assembly outer membrane protein LptD (OstA)
MFVFAVVAYAGDIIAGKTVIIGDELEIRKAGEVTSSLGNSKAFNNGNVITADKMTYDKKKSDVLAKGNVKLVLKNQKGEPIEARGSFAEYNMNSQSGKIWGNNALIKYFVENSTTPYVLHAKEIDIDRKNQTLRAYNNVEVITSSGTIYSDNGVFDKNSLNVVFKKDRKRPIADIYYDGKNGRYEADEMVFYNGDNNKKIVMHGSVTGKIEIKEEDIK